MVCGVIAETISFILINPLLSTGTYVILNPFSQDIYKPLSQQDAQQLKL